jgi:hypothetical protein
MMPGQAGQVVPAQAKMKLSKPNDEHLQASHEHRRCLFLRAVSLTT